MSKELSVIKKFCINFFWNNFIINDNRFLPFLTWIYKDYNFFSLKSIKIYIIWNVKDIETYYPSWNIKKEYEKLLYQGIYLDLCLCNKNYFYKMKLKSYKFENIYCHINFWKKDIEYSSTDSIINHIQTDDNNINKNILNFLYEYKKNLNLFKIKKEKYKYMNLFISFYLEPKIKSLKNKIKFYKKLEDYWYKTLNEVFNWQLLDIKEINYYKNISIKKNIYTWKVHKVYNIFSSKLMKENYIMVAQNTNPEFIESFYKAKIVCVETKSELSHACITCKELGIPLALWAKNIFFTSENWKNISINTNKKMINL